MKFMCLVYFQPGDFDALSDAEGVKLTDDTIAEDHELRRHGKLLIGQPLQGPETAITVRVRKGKASRTDGPFAETREWLGGFFLIEAADMDEALAIAEASPIAAVGAVEVRPALEQFHSETGQGRPAI